MTYQYDGDGLRREKTVSSSKDGYKAQTTNYSYDCQHVILETGESGVMLNRYIRGINYIAHFDKASQVTDYLYNEHGDVVQTVTKDGAIVNQYDYDAFGNSSLTIETKEEPIRYGGEFFDRETGLYYLRARYYDPYTGRFISEDSYWGEQKNRLSLNLYTYAENDPIQFVDPTGHGIFGKLKAAASSVENAVVSSTKAVASTVKSAAVSTAKAVVSTTKAIVNTVKSAVVTTAKAAVSTTKAAVSTAKKAVVTIAKAAVNSTKAAVSTAKSAVVTATKATVRTVKAAVTSTAKAAVVSAAKATKAAVTTAKATVVTTAKAAVTSAKKALTSTAKAVASTTKAIASTAKAATVSATKAVVSAAKLVVASAKNILSEAKRGLDIKRKQDTPLARSINQTVGIAEGAWSFGKSTVMGIASVVAHPIETVKGLGQAVAHPIETGKAIGGAISAEWSKNVAGDSADTRSRAKFFTESALTIGSFFVGAGELKAVATASKVEKTVEAATVATDVAKVGTTASKVADIVPEIVTSAPRPGRLKLDLQHFASDAEDLGKVDDFAKEPFLPDEYYKNNYAPIQGTPGDRIDFNRLGSSGQIENSRVIYDQAGKQKYRIDYTNHGNSAHHTDPHMHEYNYQDAWKSKTETKYFMDPSTGRLRQGEIDEGTNKIKFVD
ncbi:hypothetical protein H1230_29975 [Paenibacillus sp. 19GGS1-52]|uniref:RHS repeat-associated core domain-containing protein n=1 Tax=Paenibacillus sp. 19GGS1-52 TaxID=2758563 RepID=UPI001EFBD553|nr:RHS repeat-associated core domain-containing protein [Paenibacillus sp. 19GGS1-52]ULO07118.1 hypothetical protein H1230_29975 [Paenibacillus sp. 19GGS1-52]